MATEVTPPAGEMPEGSTTPPTGETPVTPEPVKAPTSETLGQDARLPEDHPLVKSLAYQKATLATQKSEITELRAKSAQVTKLEEDLSKRPTSEAVETLQTRYDRLEQFLQTAGGPLGKALDSRTFTKALFETTEDITEIVKKWNAANPSVTSTALGAAGATPASKSPDMNALLRSALK